MELCFNQMQEIVTGAVCIEEENGAVKLYRFTKEQEELYRTTKQGFLRKCKEELPGVQNICNHSYMKKRHERKENAWRF